MVIIIDICFVCEKEKSIFFINKIKNLNICHNCYSIYTKNFKNINNSDFITLKK